MSEIRNVRRTSVGAIMSLLAGSMAFGGATLLPVTTFAANGSITISQKHNADATYDAYRIVKGTVTPAVSGSNATASNIAWESDGIRNVVLSLLDASTNGADETYPAWLVSKGIDTQDDVTNNTTAYQTQHNLAQNAIEYISLKIGSSANAGTEQSPDAKTNASFATKLADTISGASVAPTGTATSGTAYSDVAGYYLFVSTPSTITGNDMPTHPIWAPIADDATLTMQEKTFTPTVSQVVKVDREGSDWHSIVDANKGDAITYKTTVTLPDDFDAYASYPITITNEIEPGITPSTTGLKVIVDGVDVTSQCTVGIDSDGKPYATVPDLKTLDLGAEHDPASTDSTIEFIVPSTINETATIGIGPNTNDNIPSITYPKDSGTGTASITGTGTSVATYRIDLSKVDKETRKALAGAKFYVKSGDKYVKTDGSLLTYTGATTEEALSTAGLLFESGVDGSVPIPRLDEGTYVVSEVIPPTGYDAVGTPLTMQIVATKNQTGIQVSDITFNASGWTGLATPDATTKIVGANEDGICSYSVDNGSFTVRISNTKEITLPVTGLRPRQLTTIIGASVLLLSMFLWLRSRRDSDSVDDEA